MVEIKHMPSKILLHRSVNLRLILLAILFLSACQSTNQKSTPTPLPAEERVTFMTDSGLEIAGKIYRPTESEPPWPGVLLLHMIYAQRQDWADFAKYLAQNGLVALAIDLRGHGKTGGEMDWVLARQDLNQVWRSFGEFPEVDPNQMAVIGASMGANMAVLLGADQPGVRALGLLSPGVNYYMVQTPKPLAEYGERPVLIIASQEDTYAARSAEELLKYARGEARLEMFDGIGHGTQMLINQPDLTSLILEWLQPILQ